MIAIYRSGYGYIDTSKGMEISGLEDEFRFAQELGLPALVYVLRSSENRDSPLASMITEIERGPYTIAFYENADDLRDRIRNDLTALITERFISAGQQRGVLQETSANILARAWDRTGVVVDRPDLIMEMDARSRKSSVLCLYGPPGIGKTTLAAQFAQSVGAVFVRTSGLAPKDLFAACANALRGGSFADAPPYSTLEGARQGLMTTWAEAQAVTMVVDECDFPAELIDALTSGGGTNREKRLIFTSREPSNTLSNMVVPPLTRSEVDQILSKTPITTQIAPHLFEEGNPLKLQQALARSGIPSAANGLARIAGTAGELVRYLALSGAPLSAEELLALRDDSNYSIETLHCDIRLLGRLADDTPRGFRLMHAETAKAVLDELRESPQRLRFYVNRLIRLFEDAGDLRRVYGLASLLGDGSEVKYAPGAAREAARLGDWRLGVKLTDQLLEQALDTESKAEAFHLMISLIYPLELMGNLERASELLERARSLAKTLGASALAILEETEISSRARRSLSLNDVAALEGIYRRYGDLGQFWDQARIGLELSAIYIAANNYEKARDILRPTLKAFEDLGDDYGADLAQRNLASTLSAIPGFEEESEQLINAIEGRTRNKPDARRQRAWLCNILTRRLRMAGRYEEAEALANEAIELGAAMGDEYVRAINLINLGNVYVDRQKPELAIKAYQAAAGAAQKCGRQDVEADSSRLIAEVFNDFSNINGYDDCRTLAKFYALHAIGLLQDTLNYNDLACSQSELGQALEALGIVESAAQAFFESATAFEQVPDEDNRGRALVCACRLALPDHIDLYLERLSNALGVERPNPKRLLTDQFLALVKPLIQHSPRVSLISLLGKHLYEVWSHLPEFFRGGMVSRVTAIIRELGRDPIIRSDPWRMLYAGVVLSYLLKDKSQPFLRSQLAMSVMDSVEDVFVRETGGGSRLWTVVLNLGPRVSISLSPLDETAETDLATFALATFIKGFEDELRRELIGGVTDVYELTIHLGRFDALPPDARRAAEQGLGLTEALNEQGCAITRPTGFDVAAPTFVLLSPTFSDGIAFGEGRGGSLQILFACVLVELTFQLLRGQVEVDAIRPKVASLVERTMS